MAARIKHQALGEIHGRQGDGVTQFLGIKYASLKDRFAASELFEYDGWKGVIDGTKSGRVSP
jgi:carboxylesterase type B